MSEPRVVYTGGTFDLFHVGHVRLLRACASLGRVVVGLNTDDFIRRYKGEHPVQSYAAREEVLLSCYFVAGVVPNDSEDSRPTILAAQAEIIVVGDDWKEKDYYKQMGFTPEWLKTHGIHLIYRPRTPGVATSGLRRHLID